ncbi:MAG: hypothetical protein H5T50_01815 [Nitrososphaeria archaeon]|nr:hypothetical protein [Nitrososphaeria archaeon]
MSSGEGAKEEIKKREFFTKKHAAITLLLIGIAFLVIPFTFAINVFLNYRGLEKTLGLSISDALVSVSFDIIDLVAKLAFLGVCVWIGAIVLKNSVELFKEKSETK